jgi:hypothetical protein
MYRNYTITEEGLLKHCQQPVEWIDCPDHKEWCYATRCRVCKEIEKDCEEY